MTYPSQHIIPPGEHDYHTEDEGCVCDFEVRQAIVAGKWTNVFLHAAIGDPEAAWAR